MLKNLVENNQKSQAKHIKWLYLFLAFSVGFFLTATFIGLKLLRFNFGIVSDAVLNKIQNAVETLKGDIEQNGVVAQTIHTMSKKLTQSSDSQTQSLETTSSSLEELSNILEQNLQNAEKSQVATEEVRSIIQTANQSMDNLIDSIGSIQDGNKQIQTLSKMIQDIQGKTELINEIVFQTNLLSFNASVEAARAGNYGKGFSVVAEEIGKLAKTSGQAAQEISKIVLLSVETAQNVAEKIGKMVQDADIKVQVTAGILMDIQKVANGVSSRAKEIVVSSKEQAIGIRKINEALLNLERESSNNGTLAKESLENSQQLMHQAEALENVSNNLSSIVA